MRATLRLLAAVKPGRYLEAGNPTGLTGLFNHPTPRPALLYLYGSTLDKLKGFPEHSVYRKSTEALTKHRMSVIQSIEPEGYEEWAKEAAEKIEKHPEAFKLGRKDQSLINWKPEPALEASQIGSAEEQIGGGLIEEVIQVAEGELQLVDTMAESKVWEELEEKPQPGQWDYFNRDQHTPPTQEPPNK